MKNIHIDETATWQQATRYLGSFPGENEELLPGIKWGNHAQLYTPAFWKLQYLLHDFSNIPSHKLATNLIDEVVMCILGGYGIPSEVGILAFNNLKSKGCIKIGVSFDEIANILSNPMENIKGKMIRYRFAKQKSTYIHRFLNRADLTHIPQDSDLDLRKWLLSVDGIGLKTASWITRNWLQSNNVAIIDIHLLRAGQLTGFFKANTVSDYLRLEKEYLDFCTALQVLASNMDALIWGYMKKNTKLASRILQS